MKPLLLLSVMLAAVSCRCGVDANDIVPKPQEIRMRAGVFAVDSAAFATSPADYASIRIDSTLDIPAEGYVLKVRKNGINVLASTDDGAFYALQTLRQLVTSEGVPAVDVTDSPRFGYRGIHLDVSRHFFPKEEVFKLLDEMAYYKFNYFHLHLTDNGGWRIKLDSFPELTEKGSYRTQIDWRKWWDFMDRRYLDEGTPGAYGGYYTKDDIRQILARAERNHIEVIPEIEFPAHSDAVFMSHPELCCEGVPYASGEYCAGNPATYEFFEKVLDEIIELFPSEYVHIGGDEARKKSWRVCPKCQALMEREKIADYDELQCYMIDRVEDYLRSKGKKMAGWDELTKNELDPGALVYSYRGQNFVSEAANKKQNVVFTPGAALYFDWYQDTPDTQPIAMTGYSPLKKVYMMEPVASDEVTAHRNEDYILGLRAPEPVEHILPENAGYVIGVQGCAWSEFINDCDHLEYMTFPRALAVAELGWTNPELKDWSSFRRRVNAHVAELRKRGVNCYPLSDRLDISSELLPSGNAEVSIDYEKVPSEIHYTLDGSDPTVSSTLYSGPFTVSSPVTVKAARFEDGASCQVYECPVSLDSAVIEYYPYIVPEHWK